MKHMEKTTTQTDLPARFVAGARNKALRGDRCIPVSSILFPALVALACLTSAPAFAGDESPRPNIIFVLADDLGYGDLGCYGQRLMKTPNIDRMAKEGTRFTDCYAGSTVCSPSRCVLMTGLHTGHARIRANTCRRGGTVGRKGNRTMRRAALTDEDVTVADELRQLGYRTGLVGKWHLGGYDPEANPMRHGFDWFRGWLVHNVNEITPLYYSRARMHNNELVPIPENQDGKTVRFHTDLSIDESMEFITESLAAQKAARGDGEEAKPFFLYLALINPHDPMVTPPEGLGEYEDKPWKLHCKQYAAMMANLDRNLGRLLGFLKKQGIDEETIVFFASDSGARSIPTPDLTELAEFFDSSGPLTGYKRDMTDGGIRAPMIVRWPGHVPAGKTSDAIWGFVDVFPTAVDLAGGKPKAKVDGVSVVPLLLGKEQDTQSRFLYWEHLGRGFHQAVRHGKWKAVRLGGNRPWRLYDLSQDIAEKKDVARDHPGIVRTIDQFAKENRVDSPNW